MGTLVGSRHPLSLGVTFGSRPGVAGSNPVNTWFLEFCFFTAAQLTAALSMTFQHGAVLLKLRIALRTPPSPLHHGFPEADAVSRDPIGRGVEESSWYVLAEERVCRLSNRRVPPALATRYACMCFVPYRQDI